MILQFNICRYILSFVTRVWPQPPTQTHPFLGYRDTVTCKTDSEILLWDFEMAARGTTIKDGPGDSAARAGKCLISTIVLRGQIHWVLIHALIFLPPEKCVLCLRFMSVVSLKMGLSVKWGYLVPEAWTTTTDSPLLLVRENVSPAAATVVNARTQLRRRRIPPSWKPLALANPFLEAPTPTHPLPLHSDNNLLHRTSIPITFAP